MKLHVACLTLAALTLNANAFPFDQSLLKKYCFDEACLFMPVDAIPQTLLDKAANTSDYARVKAMAPTCDGIGTARMESILSSGKSVALGFSPSPEAQGKHFRVDDIQVDTPGVFSKQQLETVTNGLIQKFGFNKKDYVDMGSWVTVTKKDKGVTIQLTGSYGDGGMRFRLGYQAPGVTADAFARQPACKSATPNF